MFDTARIKTALAPLVGFRQNDNPEFGTLSPSLLYDGDNVLVSHPLVNIENLDMLARNYGHYVFPTYEALTAYVAGDKVTHLDVNYEALGATTGETPASSPSAWKVLNLLDLYLQDVRDNAAEDTVNEVLNRKKMNGFAKTVMNQMRFFEGAGNYTDLIIDEGDLVGVQIKLNHTRNMVAIIHQIGLQLSAPQNPVTLYLYHSSQAEPIETITVNHTKTTSFQWHDVSIKLQYLSSLYDRGGVFFLMYDQAALTGQAIKKKHNFHLTPCGYCDNSAVNAYNAYSPYVTIQSCRVKAANRNGVNMWDIEKTELTAENNYGLNFEMSVRCDLTDYIVLNKDVFRYAVRDMFTKKLLEVMANTTRQSGLQGKVDVLARNELMSSYAGGMGFMKQLDDQLKGVEFEVSSMDSFCMPCGKKGGIAYGTATLSRR
jgi:hypothetical protein